MGSMALQAFLYGLWARHVAKVAQVWAMASKTRAVRAACYGVATLGGTGGGQLRSPALLRQHDLYRLQ